MVTIRPAAASDLDAVSALAFAMAVEINGPEVAARLTPELRDEIAAALGKDADDLMVVAERERRLVGCGRARVLSSHPMLRFSQDPRHCYFELMYVVPEERGTGIGSRILGALESWARERGVSHLTLHHASKARTFYERRGYSALGEMYKRLG